MTRQERFLIALAALAAACLLASCSTIQTTRASTIKPTARMSVIVTPPPAHHIEVPERFQGVRAVRDKSGKELEVDFTATYRGGYLTGWRDFLAGFQNGDFDLDEAENLEKLVPPYQSVGGAPFYPGQLAGSVACRDALRTLATERGWVYLPARPPWLKQILALGACSPLLNKAGRPTSIWWNWTTEGEKLCDQDLQLLRDVPLGDLEEFGMNHVSVTDGAIANLPSMPKLTELEISGPLLTGACLRTLPRFFRLKSLRVPGLKSVTITDVAALGELRELESLDLQAVEIEDGAVPALVSLPKLTCLILDWSNDFSQGPKLTPAGISKLAGFRNLRCLRLSGCAVDDATLVTLARSLPKLDDLFVERTSVTDSSMSAVRRLSHLAWLNIAHTKVTDAGLAALSAHRSIRTLSLQGTAIGDASLATLATMPQLEKVWAHPGQFGEAALRNFQKRRPLVRIEVVNAASVPGGQVPVDAIRP